MRTQRVLSSAVAALTLLTASGCMDCGTPPPPPAQAVVAAPAPVTVVAAPAAVTAQRVVVVNRPDRWHLRRRCTEVVAPCNLCENGKLVVVAQPVKVVEAKPARVVVLEPAKTEAAAGTVTVLQRGRKGRLICYDGKSGRLAARLVAVAPAPAVAAPVVVADCGPVVAEAAVVEPVAVVETAPVPAVEEPSWTKYLAPEQPTVVAAAEPIATEAVPAEPTAQFMEPATVYAVPAVPAVQGRQPIVIQPIIQPVIQTGQGVLPGQEVLSGQVQGQPLVTFQPAFTTPGAAAVPPVMAGSTLAANPLVCGPGQNCFTLPEDQLKTGPQVLTPTASAPLATQARTTAVASAAPATTQDKYGALTAASEPARQVERPEVSMPAPLGRTTTPPVAGTAEIENALDVMLGNDTSPLLK